MSGEKKAKGWRFYGLVGFGAIALLSAGVWALQYSGSGPEKTLSPLVVHNNLQIDLNEPDRDRKSTRLNSSHSGESRMPSSA